MSDGLIPEGLKHRDIGTSEGVGQAGNRLRNAREEKGWSVQETAEMLHIIPRYVAAIESSDFAKLPGLVFLKGYIRAYASLVGLAERPLMEDLENDLAQSDHLIVSPAPGEGVLPPLAENKQKPTLWVVLSFLIVVSVGFFLWSHWDNEVIVSTPSPKVEPEKSTLTVPDSTKHPSDTVMDTSIKIPSESADYETTSDMAVPLEIASIENNQMESLTDETELASEETVTLVPESEAATSNITSASDSIAVELSPDIYAGTEEVKAQQESIEGLAEVKAQFNGDCWFDLRDRDNNRVVGLYRSGDSVEFNGLYPLKFIVGAVDVARITVNNQPLDFSNYAIKKNRAQFTLE